MPFLAAIFLFNIILYISHFLNTPEKNGRIRLKKIKHIIKFSKFR